MIAVLYGSEGGNAQEYAQCLYQRLRYLLLDVVISPMNDFSLRRLVSDVSFLFIVCSTTGQGQLPRNASGFFHALLRKSLPSNFLDHIAFSSFGIGDSSYPKFNHAARKLHTRLVQLGCDLLSPACEADEMAPQGVDEFFKEWVAVLVQNLLQKTKVVEIDQRTLLPPVNTVYVGEATTTDPNPELVLLSRIKLKGQSSPLRRGLVVLNDRMTAPDHFQDVREFIIGSEGLNYAPGDTAVLYPTNDPRSVNALIELQPHWASIADKIVTVYGPPFNLPGGMIAADYLTLRSLITYHLDLSAVPTRSFFALLAHFASTNNEDEQREHDKLEEFGSFADPQELYDYANRTRRLVLEAISEFSPTVKIPVEYVYDLFPKITPRDFSIACKPLATRVELVVAIVEYRTRLRRIRRGLCTLWLKQLQPGAEIVFLIGKMGFSTATKAHEEPPLIVVAPGTGIAPAKALIETIAAAPNPRKIFLFYGCRQYNKDYLFHDTWEALQQQGILELCVCLSRDAESGRPKYVQDGLFQEKQKIGSLLLQERAMVFVCGSSGKMPRQVRLTFAEIIVCCSGMTSEAAEKYLIKMEDEGRYREDCW